ncbi:hypothetical protein P1A145kb_p055 [Pectobacterium phage DU_PP_I]|nr:hypothetical protein P1A145kb_p055 [Pectobacterium phage DU_PP_I]ATS93771.1 hypothetical protein P12B145kb_p055 [Pectobacterium phage DU_PP_IV]
MSKIGLGQSVRVIKEVSVDSPLEDNGWQVGDEGIVILVNGQEEFGIIVARNSDRNDTLGFSAVELEVIE